jgi:hypothetical protein
MNAGTPEAQSAMVLKILELKDTRIKGRHY